MTRRYFSLLSLCVLTIITALAVSANAPLMYAEVMSSGNFKIDRDSINFGGGASASNNFSNESTMGEIATGNTGSNNFNIRGGYQQVDEAYIAVTAAEDVTMDPALGGVTGGTSNGSTTITVTTDSVAGYQLSVKASSSPAMQGDAHGSSIADYTPVTLNPDFTFSVPATTAEFGFSPEGSDIVQRFKDDGASCNTGSGDTQSACWAALSTSNQSISSRTSANLPSGTQTKVRFRITLGSSNITIADTYTATTTLTALAL